MDKNLAKALKSTGPKKKFILYVAVVLLVIGLASTSIFFYQKYQDLKNNPEAAAQDNVQALTEKVGKLIKLPDETPTVAVVQDKESLKGQSFFSNAENGDKVLIFSAAKQAILYRESENKLINVGPVSLDDSNTAGEANQQ